MTTKLLAKIKIQSTKFRLITLQAIFCAVSCIHAEQSIQAIPEQKIQTTQTPEQATQTTPAPQQQVTPGSSALSDQAHGQAVLTLPAIPTKMVSGKTEITVGSSLPLTGEAAIIGVDIANGANLFFDKIKKEDKTSQISIKLSSLDDTGEVTKARTNIEKLSPTTPLLLNLFGTDIVLALLDQIKEKKIAALFPIEGLDSLRYKEYANMIYFRTSHRKEIQALINYTVKTLNKKKFGIFYEASAWGEGVLSIFKEELQAYGLKPVAAASYPQQTVDVAKALSTIAAAAPNAIICIAHARPAYNFIRQAINKNLHKSVFVGLSTLIPIQKTLKQARGVKIVASSVVPDPVKSNLPIAKEYRKDMKKYLPYKNISNFSFEGYINAALFYDCIQKVQAPYSIEKIIATLELFKNSDFKGLALNFDQETRCLSHNVWINTGNEKKEWFLSSVDKK
jgi:branched-chain amino acid transport system substrate-binding protein